MVNSSYFRASFNTFSRVPTGTLVVEIEFKYVRGRTVSEFRLASEIIVHD